MDELLEAVHANKCNLDLLTGYDAQNTFRYGVRLRPWKQTSRPEMIIATGATLYDAIANACEMAAAGRWEPMAWEKRPWTADKHGPGSWNRVTAPF